MQRVEHYLAFCFTVKAYFTADREMGRGSYSTPSAPGTIQGGTVTARDDRTYEGWEVTNIEPSLNWKQGQRPRERKSISHTIRGAMSMVRSAARRADFGELELGELVRARTELDAATQLAVDGLRARGCSWADIGAAVGTSREAAFQRWGRR
jgi:hypothetical protein